MVNKLIGKAMGRGGPLSTVAPKPKRPEEVQATKKAPNAGHSGAMSEDDRMHARMVLDDLTRAEGHKRDKALMKNVARFAAEHKENIDHALSGAVTRGKKR